MGWAAVRFFRPDTLPQAALPSPSLGETYVQLWAAPKQDDEGVAMGRFYEKRVLEDEDGTRYFVVISLSAREKVEVEVDREVSELLDELQREHWRIERSESRHTWHIEGMRESDLPHAKLVPTPEDLMMQKVQGAALRAALLELPEVQRRRFLLHHLEEVPVRVLARMEGCSDRAIKYSLAIARKNLRESMEE